MKSYILLDPPRMLKAGRHAFLPLWCGLDAGIDLARSCDSEGTTQRKTPRQSHCFVAVLQAGARFQFTYLVIMGVGLASLPLLMIDWLSASFPTWPHTGISWPLLLCALYFGVLSQQLADRAARLQASCARVHEFMSNAWHLAVMKMHHCEIPQMHQKSRLYAGCCDSRSEAQQLLVHSCRLQRSLLSLWQLLLERVTCALIPHHQSKTADMNCPSER